MDFKKIVLPYSKDALAPVISAETMEYHYEKHYTTYLANCNRIKQGTEYEHMSLEEIIKKSSGGLFNNAAQTFNHEMFFTSLSPKPKEFVNDKFLTKVNETFGALEELKVIMTEQATTLFGSGWTWLALKKDGELQVISGSNAYSPIVEGMIPLLCIDVWEHAYYVDYRNRRADFVKSLWSLIDWSVVEDRYLQGIKHAKNGCGCKK